MVSTESRKWTQIQLLIKKNHSLKYKNKYVDKMYLSTRTKSYDLPWPRRINPPMIITAMAINFAAVKKTCTPDAHLVS